MQSIHLSINTTEGPGPEWGVADDLLCVYNCVQVEEIRQLVDSELGYATGTTLHTKRSKVSNKFTYYVLNCYPLQISRHCHICCGDHSPPVPLYCPFSPLLFPLISLLPPLLFPLSPFPSPVFLLSPFPPLLCTSPLSPSSPSSTRVSFPSNKSWHNVGHYFSVPLYIHLLYIIMEVFPIFPCSSNFVQTSITP